ncbi:trypsin-like serine protease [Dietzia alimentaria]|uniref:trypsin-like serine protease n=1 Tax=Dietzia alimentaria TaxID=665550 RepID=UPI00029A2A18|nr:trypsin-like serine protease [Dietzia alimentaria]
MRFTRPSGTTRPTRLGRVIAATTATLGTLAASLAVATPAASAVVNGEPSAPAPWAVQITTFSGVPGTPCSGVVVAPHWVATAKHCGPADPNAYTLGFGNWAAVPGGMGSSAPVANPGIVSAFGALDTGSLGRHTPEAAYHAPAGDVMLLKLRHPAPAPAVRRAGVDPAPGDVLRFHGFGQTQFAELRSPLLLTGLTRLGHMEHRGGHRVGHSHTIQGGYDYGDSGGPVFRGDLLVGLHAGSDHARRKADGTNPARYESIPAQNGWIDWMIANR